MVIHVKLFKKDIIEITPEEIIENMNYIDNMLKDDKIYVINTNFVKNKNYYIILCIMIIILFLLIFYIKKYFIHFI